MSSISPPPAGFNSTTNTTTEATNYPPPPVGIPNYDSPAYKLTPTQREILIELNKILWTVRAVNQQLTATIALVKPPRLESRAGGDGEASKVDEDIAIDAGPVRRAAWDVVARGSEVLRYALGIDEELGEEQQQEEAEEEVVEEEEEVEEEEV